MDKINPALYITDTDPTDLDAYSPSTWYVTEEQADIPLESVGWMQAQGWSIAATVLNAESGRTLYTMSRRRIDPELVLKDMVVDYTSAYNEGRDLNDQRYDEIITLYTAVVDKSEDEFNSLESDDSTYDTLIEALILNLYTDHTDYADDVDGALDDYGDSIRSQINTRFDNLISDQRASLVTRGMYNTTIWNTVEAGIERERTLALSDFGDKLIERQIALDTRIKEDKTQMRTQILAARDRLRNTVHASANQRLASRNAVLLALVNFMERRTDGYPDLSQLGQLAASLGAGNPEGIRP